MGILVVLGIAASALVQQVPAAPGSCPTGSDSDFDGLSDSCELGVAARFAPILVVSPSACNWDAVSERLQGAYLFGVKPTPRGLRVVYLPAYLQDCGWAGAKCLLRLRGGCSPHTGDSEFIAVDLTVDSSATRWQVEQVFLSAHCFGDNDPDCRWHIPSELEWLEDTPFVWVAEGKNANYRSRSACDSGHWYFDTCDRNERSTRFPITSSAQNIGSERAPFPQHLDDPGCVVASEAIMLAGGGGTECIWTDSIFHGWQDASEGGSTGYRRYLVDVAQFASSP
ncbi:MAG: hypothetical protein ABL963_05000 [Longimicrobiales bacterium]